MLSEESLWNSIVNDRESQKKERKERKEKKKPNKQTNTEFCIFFNARIR